MSDTKDLKGWESAVHWAAKVAWKGAPVKAFVSVTLAFLFERPSRTIYDRPTTDLDKLCRAVLDALTGAIYEDDKYVAHLAATKEWSDWSGCLVRVMT